MVTDNKIKVKPKDNNWIYFSNAKAYLHILGSKEMEIHERPNRIHYGMDEKMYKADNLFSNTPTKLDFIYILPLSDLVKVIEKEQASGKYELNEYTSAIKKDGILQIIRVKNIERGYVNTATFFGKDQDILLKYLNLEKNKKRKVLA